MHKRRKVHARRQAYIQVKLIFIPRGHTVPNVKISLISCRFQWVLLPEQSLIHLQRKHCKYIFIFCNFLNCINLMVFVQRKHCKFIIFCNFLQFLFIIYLLFALHKIKWKRTS